jgi:DNA-binding transcriptional LysR family regulator
MRESRINSAVRANLKTRQLALLIHLDEERCVLRAAESCGMTQPAASKLLRDMEEALDVRLFDRHARGVEPTWYGEVLVRHARQALSEIGEAHDEIAALKAGLSGQASIGTVMNPGTNLVPAAIARLKRQHPAIRVSIDMDHSKTLVERLLQGHLDMLVARISEPRSASELNFEPLGNERHAAIAGAQHPLAGKPGLKLQALADQPWIFPASGNLLRDRLLEAFLREGLPVPGNIVQTSSLPVITALLRTTDMVVALPEEVVTPYVRSGVLTVLLPDIGVQTDSFGIVTRRQQRLSPGAQTMLRVLRETAADMYPLVAQPAA